MKPFGIFSPRERKPVRHALVRLLVATLAAVSFAGSAQATSSACTQVNADWSGGRTSTAGDPGDWLTYSGFSAGEKLTYSATTSGSSTLERSASAPGDPGSAVFAVYTDFTTAIEIRPQGGSEGNGGGDINPTASDNYHLSIQGSGNALSSGQVTAVVTCAATASTPVAGNASTSVAANSSANPVTLALSGGAAASVSVASAPSHGTATASGTAIAYTPNPGFSGSDSLTYTATNSSGTSAPATINITVNAPTLAFAPASGALAGGTVGTAYSQTLSASGGTGPYAFASSGGALPAGLSLSSGGALSGTPTAAGTTTVAVTATDANGASGTATYTITVAGAPVVVVTLSPGTLADGTVGTIYSQTLSASGGTGPYTFAPTGGALPAGLSLSSGGTLSGTPTAVGSTTVAVTATDANGATGSASYTIAVAVQAPVANAVAGTVAANSANTSITLNVTGGGATSVAVASAASHGTATASGISIIYTPTTGYSGADSFTYTATNASGTSAPATVSITVTSAPPAVVTLSPASGALASGTVGTAYSQTLSASGGAGPYTFAIGGALPTGLSFSSGGAFSGTPIAAGSTTVTATATDANGITGSANYTLLVSAAVPAAPVIGAATSGDAQASVSFTAPASDGGATIASYTVTSSPGGLIASGSASPITITGLTNGTSYRFTVAATNSVGTGLASAASGAVTPVAALAAPTVASNSVTVAANSSVNPVPLALSGGAAASVSVATQAGHGTASAAGTSITYTPVAGYSGADSFTYTAANAAGTSAPATVSISVTPAPAIVTLSPATGALADGTIGAAYSQTLSASGGTGPYSFAATGGALPAGLSLGSSGILSGTPSAAGHTAITVTATDTNGASASAHYTLAIVPARVAFAFSPSPGTLPEAMAGEAYKQPISAAGGSGTKIYSLVSGSLPDGIVLNITTGELNGPSKAGTEGDYSFTVAVTDGNGAVGLASYVLKVKAQTVAVVDKAVTVAPGEAPGNVYLNADATGGPFVRAAIVRISPADAGTAEIVEGEVAALQAVRPRGFYLKFTPKPLFAGTATVDYTMTNALGVSDTGTVSYTVALDREAVAEKADRAVRDFVSARQGLLSNHARAPGLVDRRRASQAAERATVAITPNGNGLGVSVATSTAQLEAARRADDPAAAAQPIPLLNVWIDGTVLAHKQGNSVSRDDDLIGIDADGTDDDNGWGTFALLSAGADYLVADNVLLGVTVNSDRMTDPGRGTHVDGTGVLFGPYASIGLAPSLYLDASLLYGQSWNDVDVAGFDGRFDTTRFMATTKLEGLFDHGAMTLRPNLKLSYLTEKVDYYDVSNEAERVAVEGFTEDDLRFSAGLTASYAMSLANGLRLSPELGGSFGLSSANGSDSIGDGLFGTVEAGFTLADADEWTLRVNGTLDLEDRGARAIGGRVVFAVPF